MTCSKCGHDNPAGSRFCRTCGGALGNGTAHTADWSCTHCGRSNRETARFCAGCGQGVTAAEPVVAIAAEQGHAAAMASCASCGASLAASARFCKACGASIVPSTTTDEPAQSEPAASVAPPASPPAAAAPEPAMRAAPSHATEAVRNAVSTARMPSAGRGKTRVMAIAAAVIVVVAGIGALVAYRFMQSSPMESTAAAVTVTDQPYSPASTAAPSTPTVAQQQALPPTDASPATAVPTEAPVAAEASRPEPASPPPPIAPAPERVVAKPAPRPKADAAPPMSDVALNLVRKGEAAFAQQDYSTAIANAKAALEVQPGLGRAKQLLKEAEQAQQQAMNSISIH